MHYSNFSSYSYKFKVSARLWLQNDAQRAVAVTKPHRISAGVAHARYKEIIESFNAEGPDASPTNQTAIELTA